MRWFALGVDFEMYGKDLIPSAELSSKICKILGGIPPAGFAYELFLDENGEKISKSKGNGITIEQWLKYASPESLSLYMASIVGITNSISSLLLLRFLTTSKTASMYISL
jgi:lysyl-tRNA synthetase class 1